MLLITILISKIYSCLGFYAKQVPKIPNILLLCWIMMAKSAALSRWNLSWMEHYFLVHSFTRHLNHSSIFENKSIQYWYLLICMKSTNFNFIVCGSVMAKVDTCRCVFPDQASQRSPSKPPTSSGLVRGNPRRLWRSKEAFNCKSRILWVKPSWKWTSGRLFRGEDFNLVIDRRQSCLSLVRRHAT